MTLFIVLIFFIYFYIFSFLLCIHLFADIKACVLAVHKDIILIISSIYCIATIMNAKCPLDSSLIEPFVGVWGAVVI